MQRNYTYDPAGNILSIRDNGNNSRSQYFGYDNINRLVSSNGGMNCYGNNLWYASSYTYSPAGRLLTKNVSSQRMSTTAGIYSMNYQNTYDYDATLGNPFAVSMVRDSFSDSVSYFGWDANGNMISGGSPYSMRRLCWTEDNRLQGYAETSGDDIGIAAYYNYTAGGERNFKITSTKLNIRQNGEDLDMRTYMRSPTLYASALITINKNGYSKHYFEGANRICSKIGGGFSHVDWHSIDDSVPSLSDNYEMQYLRQQMGLQHTLMGCVGGDIGTEGIANLYAVLKHEYTRNEPEPVFYYHSDHLGSTSYLTDDAGNVTQTLNYLPYGEDWVDIQNYVETRYPRLGIYTYNGKEKDYESGFHYYGARYYWSELLTGWLSVDPMIDSLAYITPYSYCINNPIKLKDNDGNIPIIPIIIGAIEIGTTIYDAIGAGKTLLDNNATPTAKWAAVGGLALDIALPGGGYGAAYRMTSKTIFKIAGKEYRTASEFYKASKKLSIGERMTAYKEMADEVASKEKWGFDKTLSKKKRRSQNIY